MKKIFSYILIVILILIQVCIEACQNSNNSLELIQIINIEAGFKNQKELFLSDIADSIGYVKLETTPECLIGNGNALIRDNKIFFKMSNPDRILIFDMDGKYISKLDKIGKGPGEYTGIFQWTVSPRGERLAFSDMATQTIYLYTSEGDFLNKTRGTFMWYSGFYFRNDEELLVCTREVLNQSPDFPVILQYTDNLTVKDTILSKEWIGVSTLPPGLPGIHISFYVHQRNFFYKEMAADTLYELDDKFKLEPRFVFDLGDKSMDLNAAHSPNKDAYYQLHSFCETKDYFSFVVGYHKKMTLMYFDKTSVELFSLPNNYSEYGDRNQVFKPKNDLDGFDYPFNTYDTYDDKWTSLHHIVYLKELEKEGFFSKASLLNHPNRARLAELVKASHLNDNPIIRILYLK